MPWRGPTPERPYPSLGWLFLDWTHAYLPSPADEKRPLVYTPEQARRIVRWFELDPDTGEYVYTELILEEAKGWGKSPFAASLALGDFAGPVCFDGWDANGEPVGVPWGTGERPPPWFQIAAVSEDQTENTYAAVYSALIANEHRAARELRIDDGRTRLYLRDVPGAKLEPVTASHGSREGQRVTGDVLDETNLWKPRNGGVKLAATIRRNATKMGGRTIQTLNAPVLGSKCVGLQSDPDHPEPGILHFANRPRITPDPSWSDERLLATLDEVYRDATWVPKRRLVSDIRKPSTDWNDALTYWFNIRTPGGGRAVDPRRWDALAVHHDRPSEKTYIGAGFDGSISGDATILRGCLPDGWSFDIGKWVRPTGDELRLWEAAHPGEDWKVDRKDVREKVRWMRTYYRVGRFVPDPFKWHTEVEDWQDEFGDDSEGKPIVQPLDTNQARKFAPAVDRWLTGIREGTHTHDADPTTDAHVKAAARKQVRLEDDPDDGRTRYVLVKGDDHEQIDGAVADVLAYEAAMTMPPARVRPPLFVGAA